MTPDYKRTTKAELVEEINDLRATRSKLFDKVKELNNKNKFLEQYKAGVVRRSAVTVGINSIIKGFLDIHFAMKGHTQMDADDVFELSFTLSSVVLPPIFMDKSDPAEQELEFNDEED